MKKLFSPTTKTQRAPSEPEPTHVPTNDVSGPAHLQLSEDHWVAFQDQDADSVKTGSLHNDHSRYLSTTPPSSHGATTTASYQRPAHAKPWGDITRRLNEILLQTPKKKEPSEGPAVGSMRSSDPGHTISRSNASQTKGVVDHEKSRELLCLDLEAKKGGGLKISEPEDVTRKGPGRKRKTKSEAEYTKKKDGRAKVGWMIDYLTGSASEDWSLTWEICRRASADHAAAHDASRALRRVFQYGRPVSQLSAARLLAIMIRKCTSEFIVETSRPKFLGVLKGVLLYEATSPVVRERVLYVIAGTAFTYPKTGYGTLWSQVKPSDKPDEGIPFDGNDPMLNQQANSIGEHVMSDDEMQQWFLRECETSRGNAQLLSEALAFARPDELNSPVISEWYRKCRSSQDFIVAQIPWATSQVESSSEEPFMRKESEETTPIPSSKEETLLVAFLSANEDILETLRVHDELQRLGVVEQENDVGQWNPTETRPKLANPFLTPGELSQMDKSDGSSLAEGSAPSPSRDSSYSSLQSFPPQSPLTSITSNASDSDAQTSSPHSKVVPPSIACRMPRESSPPSRHYSSKPSAPLAPTVPEHLALAALDVDLKLPQRMRLDSNQDSVHGASDPNGPSRSAVLSDDEVLGQPHNDVVESFTVGGETVESSSSSLSSGNLTGPSEPNTLAKYGSNNAEPDSNTKGDVLSLNLLQHGFSAIGVLSKRPSLGSESNVSVDLPGKTVRFTNMDTRPLVPSKAHDPHFNLGNIPNLTGRIKIVRGTLLAGGFCDIFSGELMSEHGTEHVAMKMLRIFNTEAHVLKSKMKFRREVNVWRTLRHPHVLPFYGTCELDEFRLFMVSPWAKGGNSLEYLRRNPFCGRGQLLWQTASALEYLHSGRDAPQVVHGDLKADNVLVSAEGDALLCDFGLSRHVEEIISKSGSSSAGRAGGHARFMAPELLLPSKGLNHARGPTRESDVFAFASLMLQIYTEQLPFCDLYEAQAILKIASGQLPPRPVEPIILERGVTDLIWTVMTECWGFEPSERPSMEEVRKKIDVSAAYYPPVN